MKTLFSLVNTKSFVSSLFLSVALGISACGGNTGEPAECGDSTVQAGEACDDGNTQDGDGCDSSCEIEEEGPSEAELIDAYIESLSQLPAEENTGPTFGEPSAPEVDPQNSDYDCVEQEFTQIQRNIEISSFAANASGLFPGAIINGDSVYNDLINLEPLPLKPVQFSVSLQNVNGATSATMQNPNIVEFRDARNAILQAGVNGDVVVISEPEIIQVNSKEQLSVALGVDVNTVAVDVGADFNFESNEERSHFLVRVKQILFTVDTVPPFKPSDLLGDGVTLEDVQSKFNSSNPPMYVEKLIYGRLLYFTFESSVSSTELNVALQSAFDNGVTQVDATAALDFNQILSETTIKGYVIGGSASADVSALIGGSIDSIKTFIQENTTFPADDFNNFGDIIGFQLSYLGDPGNPAFLSFGGTSTIRECLRARQKVDVELMGIEVVNDGQAAGNEAEIFGNIRADGNADPVTLFSKTRDQAVNIFEGAALGATADDLGGPESSSFSSLFTGQVTAELDGVLSLQSNLIEKRGLQSNDVSLQQTNNLTASQGWRGLKTVTAASGGALVKVHFRLTPVFE